MPQGCGPDQPLEFAARLTDDTDAPLAQLTVMALPRGTLTLPADLEQTVSELSRVAGTHIDRAELDATLRVDGLPVAVIEYTATVDEPLAGYQATFIGDDPSTLVVLTFTTSIDTYATLRPQFIAIARTVKFAPSPTSGD